ncbi:hypothetical protein [Morganella morganii]|uniref:hypothetical protein n=1 Tax=Morganella morganii TaxID=582 RepID=UPI0023DDBA2C|nr:hypothetical protein [Morganella morganii]MDF2407528.1 hypothetical protein [Morganella morganii]
MQKFNRELQNHILTVCIASYPHHTSWNQYDPESFPGLMDDHILAANIYYLSEHGLISVSPQRTDDPYSLLENIRATADGIDFMMGDEGLKSVLDIRTIKIHSDTMAQLVDIISSSDIPVEEKHGILSKLRELPASAITHLTNELTVKAALALPGALQLIQKYLQNL